jgi:hypothetical protein
MEFDPNNQVIKVCLKAMAMKEAGQSEAAGKLLLQAWNESTHDLEKFISAHFLAQYQKNVSDKLNWLETALQITSRIDDGAVKSALPFLYLNIAKCYEQLNDLGMAEKNRAMAASLDDRPLDKGPFYHGTKADLAIGDLLTPGGQSNYKDALKMNHIYFTGLVNGAGLAADLAKGQSAARVYVVEPTGPFENDPNVTNKKFPGNLTRSYRSVAPLKVVGEIKEWARLTPEELKRWQEKLASNKGEIIN